jgi:hypothetical protein
MIVLNGYSIPLSDRVLISLHTFCVRSGGMVKKSEELARILQLGQDKVDRYHDKKAFGGYSSFFSHEENRKLRLTSEGIISVCSPLS